MKSNYTWYIAGAVIILALVGFFALRSGGVTPQNVAVHATTPTAAPASPAATSSPASSNPEDVVPGLYPNPIKNTATAQGLKISAILVENNTDAAGNAVSDHLQFTLQNLTSKTLSNLEAYYTVTDTANGKKEGYYKVLDGLSIPPHGSATVHFDNQTGYGHYAANIRGIYGTALDQLKFSVEVSAAGYAPVFAQSTKAPGGAEVVGQ